MEEFRSWVLTFRACLPVHRAIMGKFSDEFVFWPVASEFSLFKNTSKTYLNDLGALHLGNL